MANTGDFYVDNLTGDYYLYDGSAWALQGNLKGPQGDTGPQGPTGPSGTSSGVLSNTKTAGVAIFAGDAVKATNSTHVILADNTSLIDYAIVYGIATADASSGADVPVTIFGEYTNSIFNVFSANKPLFLDSSGGLTDVRPTSGYLAVVAKSLGGGKIFVNPQLPIVI